MLFFHIYKYCFLLIKKKKLMHERIVMYKGDHGTQESHHLESGFGLDKFSSGIN